MLGLMLAAVVAVSGNPDLVETRDRLNHHLDTFDDGIVKIDEYLREGLSEYANRPQTGLIIGSAQEPGEDGLHAVTVLGLLAKSPAEKAGIQPGDRITMIAKRRLEHEPAEVVRQLLEEKPGTLVLQVQRDNRPLTFTLKHKPLDCIRQAVAKIDKDKWLARVAVLRGISATLRKNLAITENDAAALDDLGKMMGEFGGLIANYTGILRNEETDLVLKYCEIRF